MGFFARVTVSAAVLVGTTMVAAPASAAGDGVGDSIGLDPMAVAAVSVNGPGPELLDKPQPACARIFRVTICWSPET